MKSHQNVITVIDLGSSQCTTLIAICDEENQQWHIVGKGQVLSQGLKKGNIVNLEQVVTTLYSSLDQAEKMAGFQVETAFVSISGTHIESKNTDGMIAITSENYEVTEDCIDRVIESAKAFPLPEDREIIYLTPRFYRLDARDGIKDPIRMDGRRLEVTIHVITASSAHLRNLEKCLKDLGLGLDEFVFSGLAAAESTLSETEKDLGAVAVNIGAGSTSFCAYVEGAVTYSGSLPVGASHLTQDIAIFLKVSFDTAEKIKLALSQADLSELKQEPGESRAEFNRRRRESDILDLDGLDIRENLPPISKSVLYKTVVAPREEEIFTLLRDELERKKLMNQVPGGAIISGGGALALNITEIATKTLGRTARVGIPPNFPGVVGGLDDPRYAVAIGLLQYAINAQGKDAAVGGFENNLEGGQFLEKIGNFFKKFLP